MKVLQFSCQFSSTSQHRLSQTDGQDEGDKNEDLVEVHGEVIGLFLG